MIPYYIYHREGGREGVVGFGSHKTHWKDLVGGTLGESLGKREKKEWSHSSSLHNML